MTAVNAVPVDPVAVARHAIIALIQREHAVVPPEIETRLCEQPQPGVPTRLDPQDVRLARDDLAASGLIRRMPSRTPHGRREVPVFTLTTSADPDRQQSVAEHKRDLYVRYLTWTVGPTSPTRLGAEHVVHASFQVAARSGYAIGAAPPSDVAILTPPATPDRSILMPIEVRNTRDWLMPHSRGLYQLLLTSTRIQVSEPSAPIVPLFICRRAHPHLVAMGRDLGFIVIESRREFIETSVAETAVAEVRATLGLTDLIRTDQPDRLMVSRLEQIVPTMAVPLVSRWRRTAATTIPLQFDDMLAQTSVAGRRRVLRDIWTVAAHSGLLSGPAAW